MNRRLWPIPLALLLGIAAWGAGAAFHPSPDGKNSPSRASALVSAVSIGYVTDTPALLSIQQGTNTITPSATVSASPSGAIVSGSNIKPGDSNTGTVQITNGSQAAVLTLSETNLSHSGLVDLSAQLQTQVTDQTLSALTGGTVTIFHGLFNQLPSTVLCGATNYPTGCSPWTAGEAHTFTFTVLFPTASGNPYQGVTASVDFVWTATP